MATAGLGAGSRRRDTDVMKLIKSKHEVIIGTSLSNFRVKFHGPPDTPYEGGVWILKVMLSEDYPFRPPMIRFLNKIFHPNICQYSGNVCMNVINQTWTALYDLSNVFETFLPQLLTYPNPAHPMNTIAAIIYQNQKEYKAKVKEFMDKFATEEAIIQFLEMPDVPEDEATKEAEKEADSDSESSLSDSWGGKKQNVHSAYFY